MGIISDQTILFTLLVAVFGLLVWGKIRYDLVAFGALIVAIVIGEPHGPIGRHVGQTLAIEHARR